MSHQRRAHWGSTGVQCVLLMWLFLLFWWLLPISLFRFTFDCQLPCTHLLLPPSGTADESVTVQF